MGGVSVCEGVWVGGSVYVSLFYVCKYICKYVCMCVCVYIYVCVCVLVHTHTLKRLELPLGFKSCRPCAVGRGQLLTRPLELGGTVG